MAQVGADLKLTTAVPLSRRGHGPGLLLLVDADLDLRKHDKTLDPPPLYKWTEEGFAVAQLRLAKPEGDLTPEDLRLALSELSKLPSCDQKDKIGVIIYAAVVEPDVLEAIKACPEICAVVFYGVSLASNTGSELPLLAHVPGARSPEEQNIDEGVAIKRHYYANARPFFAIPAHDDYHPPSASVAHTRTLSFLKPLVGGPYFDLEKVWDEHTYWEFEARSVEETMATMVEEPYVNHVPTLTGGIGRRALTEFYRDHFIFSNPPDTELELVSRTVGIDRVVDEFLFKATHDRMIDWLAPGIPPTGRYISVPFTSVVNIRGDRLYHEHISWDQATLLRQLGLLPDYLPFPFDVAGEPGAKSSFEYRLPVAGVESARKLANQSSVESNAMLQYLYRKTG
ncbi:carboxymethylenebutenolidase [Hypoxylon rubiginosum]|uniref:Carboxymethylenebutenolidase n=1 Tax=Hypoxylon rubiginosum TaxID=110542 RepID=A0ACB9Z0M2_9PEZI|nr:carboxymethylenebutenolidase [Hypoxylon rubiginosum]